jgi:hypothetical protein
MLFSLWKFQYRQRKMMQMATHRIPVEATIESGALEGTRVSGKMRYRPFGCPIRRAHNIIPV